jgi:hypothetical protein
METKKLCPRCKKVETMELYCYKCQPVIYRESQTVVYGEAPKPAE